MTRNYRIPQAEPVTAEEVSAHVAATPAGAVPSMLRDAVRTAMVPVTMWPSPWVGKDFHGLDCLLTPGSTRGERPEDAAPGGEPILSVLPLDYLSSNAIFIQDLKETARAGGSTEAEAAAFSRWVIAESWLCLGDFRTPYAIWKDRQRAA
ncbi:hypothetical protein [Streptomyces sp. NBC_01244]|uniref:hypothetical protein n=1 Tax=Streptomyces sp. NBC_01244 TaxID=2903797 RepID=UPI002E10BA35|nr:hypothetical protein OG247_43870 [Streptomyces sp. NBC_01244]